MATDDWTVVEGLTLGLAQEVSKIDAKPRVKALAPAVSALTADLNAQRSASNVQDLPRLMQFARGLWDEVELITGTGPRRKLSQRLLEQFSVGGVIGVLILLAAFAGVAVFFGYYISKVGVDELKTLEGSRPILTISAVLATIAFGGGLVFAALFSNEGQFENRFRMAREIFLVFSGVFATVIGFHFGKVDSPPTPPPKPGASVTVISEAAAREKDGKVLVTIRGGVAPFTAVLKLDAVTLTAQGDSPISIDLKDFDREKPVSKLALRITDSTGTPKEIAAENVKLKDWSGQSAQAQTGTKPNDTATAKGT